jgi:hypothetical protein
MDTQSLALIMSQRRDLANCVAQCPGRRRGHAAGAGPATSAASRGRCRHLANTVAP